MFATHSNKLLCLILAGYILSGCQQPGQITTTTDSASMNKVTNSDTMAGQEEQDEIDQASDELDHELADLDDENPSTDPSESEDEDFEADLAACGQFLQSVDELDSPATQDIEIKKVHGDVDVDSARKIKISKVLQGMVTVASALESDKIEKIIGGGLRLNGGEIKDVEKIKGELSIKAETIRDIEKIHGSVCIQSETIRKISQVKGPMMISAESIEEIEKFHGDLYLHGATVQKVKKGKGTIHLCDGAQIIELEKFDGEVIETCE